jgi:DNA-binding transcriptional regulator YiaG
MKKGSDIRRYRQKLKLSQEALARLLRVSWITVNRWERGDPEPSYLSLKGIEAVLKETFGEEVFKDG